MTPESLTAELAQPLRRCECGGRVSLRYQPGVTAIACIKENTIKIKGPDWCPNELAKKWNDL